MLNRESWIAFAATFVLVAVWTFSPVNEWAWRLFEYIRPGLGIWSWPVCGLTFYWVVRIVLVRRRKAADRPPTSEEAKSEAKAHPGGWLYDIGGGYNYTDAVPPQAIRGAWKINDDGEIVGDFVRNPNFNPNFRKPA